MIHQAADAMTTDPHWNWLRKTGGAAALTTGAILLIGMTGLIFSVLQTGFTNRWLSLFQNNWLVKIFILHAGFSDIQADLQGLNILDVLILLLAGVICLSLSRAFSNARRVWCVIAFALTLVAIALFAATQIAGRSTVMLAVLINSVAMLGDKTFARLTAYTGILASVFLFVGDLTVGIHSDLITTLFGVGYLLLITWLFLTAPILARPGQAS